MPFDEINEHLSARVQEKCNYFTSSSGIEISSLTQCIITTIIQSITDDPHPSWNKTYPYKNKEIIVDAYIEGIPLVLFQIAASQKIVKYISTFDFLHWFSKNFEQTMCIIPKYSPEEMEQSEQRGSELIKHFEEVIRSRVDINTQKT